MESMQKTRRVPVVLRLLTIFAALLAAFIAFNFQSSKSLIRFLKEYRIANGQARPYLERVTSATLVREVSDKINKYAIDRNQEKVLLFYSVEGLDFRCGKYNAIPVSPGSQPWYYLADNIDGSNKEREGAFTDARSPGWTGFIVQVNGGLYTQKSAGKKITTALVTESVKIIMNERKNSADEIFVVICTDNHEKFIRILCLWNELESCGIDQHALLVNDEVP